VSVPQLWWVHALLTCALCPVVSCEVGGGGCILCWWDTMMMEIDRDDGGSGFKVW
jgi:hypothetical protein